MRYFFKAFIGFLAGFIIYEAITYAFGGSFDLMSEAVKGVAIAAIAGTLMTLFERWRRSATERSAETTGRAE